MYSYRCSSGSGGNECTTGAGGLGSNGVGSWGNDDGLELVHIAVLWFAVFCLVKSQELALVWYMLLITVCCAVKYPELSLLYYMLLNTVFCVI